MLMLCMNLELFRSRLPSALCLCSSLSLNSFINFHQSCHVSLGKFVEHTNPFVPRNKIIAKFFYKEKCRTCNPLLISLKFKLDFHNFLVFFRLIVNSSWTSSGTLNCDEMREITSVSEENRSRKQHQS